MKLVFMGTPPFAVATLEGLSAAGHEIACAYTQPPSAAGRGMAERPSAVQQFAQAHGIEVRTPVSLKQQAEQERFAGIEADAAVVVAYGLLLPRPVLDAPRFGCFNVHASLLPRWRGAAPIQRAIMAGDEETGVTIMRMDEGLDTGAMCRRASVAITAATTAGTLHDELARLGARLMAEVLAEPVIACAPQPEDGVTYAKKIKKTEAKIDFARSARQVRDHIHGLSPFPGAWFELRGVRIKVLRCEIADANGESGKFLDERLTIACGDGAVRFLRLQREGKGAMEADEFLRGFAIVSGERAC